MIKRRITQRSRRTNKIKPKAEINKNTEQKNNRGNQQNQNFS